MSDPDVKAWAMRTNRLIRKCQELDAALKKDDFDNSSLLLRDEQVMLCARLRGMFDEDYEDRLRSAVIEMRRSHIH